MSQRYVKVDDLGRVEGEGALDIKIAAGKVTDIKFRIFEPPRLFEAFLIGRSYDELPDMTARICGICPVAYQMSSVHATERAFGIVVDGTLRQLRRLFYCGEWIESNTLHVYMLAAPDFLGYESIIPMASDHPDAVKRGLRLKRAGNDIVALLGGREIHPVSACVGGFTRAPALRALAPLVEKLEQARDDAWETVKWVASFPRPDFTHEIEFVSLSHPAEYPMNEGRLVSSHGLDIPQEDFEQFFEQYQVPYSNALRSRIKGRGIYFVGPLARINLNHEKLSPLAHQALERSGVKFPSDNPFDSIVARALEVLHCVDEALAIISSYEPPEGSVVDFKPRAGSGAAITEAPRGILYHRYRFDDEGLIQEAKIVPPTAQNQGQIEADLWAYVPQLLSLPTEEITLKSEMAIRNYDPCISCSTHAIKAKVHLMRL
ncbi:MAG: Ni/Fe hydrogenase subunit alpha [Chloroflexi bacterium]|nr:Ni/Fe hydrogenase subunit alpha [Chloroflexota bacterium]